MSDKKGFSLNKILSSIRGGSKSKSKAKEDAISSLDVNTDDFTRQSQDDDIATITTERVHDKIMRHSRVSTGHSLKTDLSLSEIEGKYKKVIAISKYDTAKQYKIALGGLGIGILLAAAGFGFNNYLESQRAEAIRVGTQALASIQKMNTSFLLAATTGEKESLDALPKVKTSLDSEVSHLYGIINYLGNDSLDQKVGKDMSNLWVEVSKNIDTVLAEKTTLEGMVEKVNKVSLSVNEINDLIERLGVINQQLGANQNEMTQIFFLRHAIQRINRNIGTLLLSSSVPAEVTAALKKDREDFKTAMMDIYVGNKGRNIAPLTNKVALATYDKLAKNWLSFAGDIDKLYAQAENIKDAKSLAIAKGGVNQMAEEMLKIMDSVLSDLTSATFTKQVLFLSILILGSLLSLMFIGLIAQIYLYSAHNTALEDKAENQKNQNAILRLLDEMIPLSDGDLTKETTVTEEITGAIADSINMTINDLARIVTKIKESALTIREKTIQASSLSEKMLSESMAQSNQITNTGEAVIGIATAVGDISKKTFDSSREATRSVDVAAKGASSVRASIDSMDLIKNNISDTARLMKRLDDSSKQVSQIVDLLSDITEETTVLALNATVQAAKAGEAGKGFKIVADSVQTLANKASEATRRVGALISATQTDIQAVVEAVEKTNIEVSRGSGLSEDAGKALQEITDVSTNLANIIKSISSETNKHAAIAANISNDIKGLLSSTEETVVSNKETAASINEIARLSNDLENSVKNFKVD